MDCAELEAAREALRNREGANVNLKNIGKWAHGEKAPEQIPALPEWANSRGVEAAIWTALSPKFNGQEKSVPPCDMILDYLRGLTGSTRDTAERYIRFAPRQIDTLYRRRIEAVLHWTSLNPSLNA